MNKENGFTLIELLAVIILVAIISLIATPTVINVINAAKDKSDLESVHGMVDSARLYYSESMLDSNKKTNIENLNDIYNDVSLLNKPDNGKLYINEKGLIALSVVIRNKCYTKQFSGNIQISEDTTNCTLGYVGIDTTAPTVSFSFLDGIFNGNGWAKNNFNVDITISDNESGPSSYKYCIDTKDCEPTIEVNNITGFSEINTESETNKVCVIGIDNYGNESSIICSDNYKLDKTNPTISVNNISINKNTTLDLNSDVTTNDNLSGADNYTYNPTSIDTSVAGTKTVTYTVTDLAGNSASIDRTVTVITDKPSIAYSTLTSPNGNGWFNSDFYVKAIATSDSTTNINNILWCSSTSDCTPSSSVSDNNVTAYITNNSSTNKMCVQAIDTTGNTSDVICSSNYKKDSVTPTLTAVSTAINIRKGDSYSTSSYFSTPIYGISGGTLSCSPTNTSSLETGSQTVSCTATSNSGLSTSASKTITVEPNEYTWNKYSVIKQFNVNYTTASGSFSDTVTATVQNDDGYYWNVQQMTGFPSSDRLKYTVLLNGNLRVNYSDEFAYTFNPSPGMSGYIDTSSNRIMAPNAGSTGNSYQSITINADGTVIGTGWPRLYTPTYYSCNGSSSTSGYSLGSTQSFTCTITYSGYYSSTFVSSTQGSISYGTVTSTSSSAYPLNGMSGDYWYVRQ